ncbi:MAG: chemotaxis protein CheW [Bryobacteraceae bacterium]
MAGERMQYATFHVAELFFGIEVLHVQEVLRHQTMTGVPLAPSVIEGLINLRGQIVTAVDLRRMLKTRIGSEASPMNIVVRGEDGPVSLLVDEIGDVIEMQSDTFERPPENMPAHLRAITSGIHKLEGRLLLVLDTERVLRTASKTSNSAIGESEVAV